MALPQQYTAENLLVRPQHYPHDRGLVLEVTPESAGWDYISFQVRRLQQGESWSFASGENELALVDLTGSFTVKSNRGEWPKNRRSEERLRGGSPHALPAAAEFIYRHGARRLRIRRHLDANGPGPESVSAHPG